MTLLGLTGGIGSGKSYVARLLHEHWGLPVYDCDAAAKRLEEDDDRVRAALVALVGSDVYDPQDGTLAKHVLARYLFACEAHAEAVGHIVHPAVQDDLRRWAACQTAPCVVVESAILYECGFDAMMDAVLFVDAPVEVRLRRAMQRDAATREQVAARMARQDTYNYSTRARYVIHNGEDTTVPDLLAQLDTTLHQLLNDTL